MTQLNTYFEQFLGLCVGYAPKLLMAIILLIVGWWAIGKIMRTTIASFEKSKINSPELKTFVGSIVGIGLKVFLLLTVAGIVGIQTTSFVGVIAAMGFAVGLALQGNLSNFASGVMILVLHPFKVGDEIEIQGKVLFVKEIQMFSTIFNNLDKSMTILPNSSIMTGGIRNYSTSGLRRVVINLNIAYTEDLARVRKILVETAFSIPAVDQKEGPPNFWIKEFNDHSINITMGFVTSTNGFRKTESIVKLAIVEALQKNKIKIAYPSGVNFGTFAEEELTTQTVRID